MFNSQMYRNMSIYRPNGNMSVPNSTGRTLYHNNSITDDLHVPTNNSVPMGQEFGLGYIAYTDPDVMQLPDGTVINIKSRRVYQNNRRYNTNQYWDNGNMNMGSSSDVWDDRPTRNINDMRIGNGQMTIGDVKRQEELKHKDQQLMRSVTKEQVDLLKAVEAGEYCSLSKLQDDEGF